jgi:hypothetical protein
MEMYNWILLGALVLSLGYNLLQALMLDEFQKALDEDTPPF